MRVVKKLNDQSKEEKTTNVDLQWNVEVLNPKSGYLPKLFRKYNNIERQLKLNIEDIVVPPEVDCDKTKLFSILYDSEIVPQSEFPINVTIKDMKTPFQLLFNNGEIKDCTRPQDADPREYPIKFKAILKDEDGKEVDSVAEQIDVEFFPLDVKPKFEIDFDFDEDQIQYSSSLGNERVGSLNMWIDEEFQFTPSQQVEITIKLYNSNKEDISEFISFASGEPKQSTDIQPGRGNVVKLPLYINFTEIPNPVEPEDVYTIEATIFYSPKYSPEIKKPNEMLQAKLRLLKDEQGTELKVYAVMDDEKTPVTCDYGRPLPPIHMSFVPRSRLMKKITVRLSNIATDNTNERAGLWIKNLMLEQKMMDDVQVIGEKGTILPDQFIKIDGANINAMRGANGFFIPNGPSAQTTITLSFDPSKIVDLSGSNNYKFTILSVLSFDYWEDRDGVGIEELSDGLKKQQQVSLKWNLHLEPNPEWLCVDYGSSAIVCKYHKEILDLKKRKENIFARADNGKFKEDTFEKGTPFLSSDVILHQLRAEVLGKHSTLCSQHDVDEEIPYLELSVCLSPTSSLVKNEIRTQLPCLKILVGNEFLPMKPDYMMFEYARLDSGTNQKTTARKAMDVGEDSCILRVSSIFNEAYATLFKYFIQPVSKEKSINKLVLTYPNTYTPIHLKILEDIVRKTFPKVRPEYLRFVGESDAVATYYMDNWTKYNPGGDITNDETVLVYDMGAGTLDITLFKKQKRDDGKIEVQILGKIGTGKAGNYLDYIISDIIKDKVADNSVIDDMVVKTQTTPDEKIRKDRFDLKEYVKNDIKPKLSPSSDEVFEYGGSIFTNEDIIEDQRYKDFLEQVTTGIIEKLLKFVGGKNLKIDTVLMSGRSCRLGSLTRQFQSALTHIHCRNAKIVKIDGIDDNAKTVVVEGALARASIFSSEDSPVIIRSRRLYASYGLIYKVLGGDYRYTELLNSSTLQFEDDFKQLEEFKGDPVKISGIVDTSVRLIQTYLSPQDTEKAYSSGDFEFISIMEEHNTASFNTTGTNDLNVHLKIDYKNNISLYINGFDSKGNPPRGVDLASEITKRSIWPVTI